MPRPSRHGGWTAPDAFGGRSCHVEQGRYGHRAKKATWLYSVRSDFPELRWGFDPDQKSEALVSWCGNHVASGERRPRLSAKEARCTPPAFADVLIALARSAGRP